MCKLYLASFGQFDKQIQDDVFNVKNFLFQWLRRKKVLFVKTASSSLDVSSYTQSLCKVANLIYTYVVPAVVRGSTTPLQMRIINQTYKTLTLQK